MSKSCERCIFAKARDYIAPPEPLPEKVEKSLPFGIKWTRAPDMYERAIFANAMGRHKASVNTITCTRFPKFEIRNKEDLCGEYQQRPPLS